MRSTLGLVQMLSSGIAMILVKHKPSVGFLKSYVLSQTHW